MRDLSLARQRHNTSDSQGLQRRCAGALECRESGAIAAEGSFVPKLFPVRHFSPPPRSAGAQPAESAVCCALLSKRQRAQSAQRLRHTEQ